MKKKNRRRQKHLKSEERKMFINIPTDINIIKLILKL